MWSSRSFPGKARGEASRESLSGCLQLPWTCRFSWNEQPTGSFAGKFAVYTDPGCGGLSVEPARSWIPEGSFL